MTGNECFLQVSRDKMIRGRYGKWILRISKADRSHFSKDNCTDPAYLPIGHLVFSGYLPGDSLKSGHSLFTCNLDGSGIKRITFNPATYFASAVLKDGRILSVSRQIFPRSGKIFIHGHASRWNKIRTVLSRALRGMT